MKRIGPIVLALLAAILMPVLIWVALFVAIREPLLRTVRRTVFAVLFLLSGIFYPILIWVGLLVAVKKRVWQWRLQRVPACTIGEILTAAGLAIQYERPPEATPVAATFLPLSMSKVRKVLAQAGGKQ